MENNFDPNGVGIANGNLFGFPVAENDANIVVIPVPWDATASYGKVRAMVQKQFWRQVHSWIFIIHNCQMLGIRKCL